MNRNKRTLKCTGEWKISVCDDREQRRTTLWISDICLANCISGVSGMRWKSEEDVSFLQPSLYFTCTANQTNTSLLMCNKTLCFLEAQRCPHLQFYNSTLSSVIFSAAKVFLKATSAVIRGSLAESAFIVAWLMSYFWKTLLLLR